MRKPYQSTNAINTVIRYAFPNQWIFWKMGQEQAGHAPTFYQFKNFFVPQLLDL